MYNQETTLAGYFRRNFWGVMLGRELHPKQDEHSRVASMSRGKSKVLLEADRQLCRRRLAETL